MINICVNRKRHLNMKRFGTHLLNLRQIPLLLQNHKITQFVLKLLPSAIHQLVTHINCMIIPNGAHLLNENGLKSDEHEESEDGVVPVLVQAPKSHTEHLKHKERRRGSLLEQTPEVWGHHVKPKQYVVHHYLSVVVIKQCQ